MKTTTLLVLCIISISLSYGQAVITKPTTPASVKTIANFGAIANDGLDDTWAFIKAGKYFSNLWDINGVPLTGGAVNFSYTLYSAELSIPSGTYLVGKQVSVPVGGLTTTFGTIFGYAPATAPVVVPANASCKRGLELIVLENPLNNIDQVVIKGTGVTTPIIKYNNGLMIGYFDNSCTPQFMTDATYNGLYHTGIGNFIQTFGCKNIEVKNIEIDGNNIPANTTYGGGFGSNLIQAGGSGFSLLNTQNVSIDNINAHHMTLDGIVFQDYYKDPVAFPGQPLSNLLITNSNFDYNRRQGFSWVGGRGVVVNNCTFNETSQTVVSVPIARGNPAAGVDIEPESDGTNQLWCMDGNFTDCNFVNNLGVGVLCDEAALKAKNIEFHNILIHDVDSYGLWTKGKAFTFYNSRIWGSFVYGNPGTVPGEETIFHNCDFADEEIASRPGVVFSQQLVESDKFTKRMKFFDCTFRTLHAGKSLMWMWTNATAEAEYTLFQNCSFTTGAACATYSEFFGCAFAGNTSFIGNNPTNHEWYEMNGLVFLGSNDPCNPSTFSVRGKICMVPANSSGFNLTQFQLGRIGLGTANTDGYTDFVIDNASALYAYFGQAIDIGKNSRFINKANGQFVILSGAFNNAGKIILDQGSYTVFYYTISINTSAIGRPEFYFHKNANLNYSSYWGPYLGWGWTPFMSQAMTPNTVIDGGNAAVTAPNAGTVNTALSFSTGAYVVVPAAGGFSKLATFGNAEFSIEVSFKSSAAILSNAPRPFFSQGSDFAFGITGLGNFYFKVPIGGGATSTYTVSPALTPQSGDCHVAVFTRGSDQLFRLYVDKVLLYSSTHPFPNAISSNLDSYIGRELLTTSGKANNFFQGDIGRVRVWNRSLTQNDICYNYGRKAPLSAGNLVADWDMTDASGTTLTDAAATPANGTLVGLLVPPPTWVTQNTVGDCVNASGINNASYINFRRASSAIVTVNPRDEAIDAISVVAVSPNPNQGMFTIDANGQTLDNALVQVFNSAGKRVWSKQYKGINKNFREQVSLSVAPGAYIVKISSADKLYQKKIIIN